MNLHKKCTPKSYSFLVKDTTLPSDNYFCFGCNLLEGIPKVIMEIDDKITDEKQQ